MIIIPFEKPKIEAHIFDIFAYCHLCLFLAIIRLID